MRIKVAIPIWDGRVSPVMDAAGHLLLVEINGGQEVGRSVIDLPRANIPARVDFISKLGIDVLICGAISQQFEQLLGASGIKIRPWFRGNVDEVIAAYSGGILQNDNFIMPGCGRRRRRGGRGKFRPGRGYAGRGRQFKEDR